LFLFNSLCLQHHYNVLEQCGTVPVPPGLMVEKALYHQCNGEPKTVPPLFMEMKTGSTNNHISQIFFVLAAPM
jgi:hypothetical protein